MNLQDIIAEVLEQFRGSWRYRWWAAAVTWAVAVAGFAYVYSIPNIYRASARVYVDTNSLIKPLMQGLTAQQNTMNEVQLVSTAVLTRPNLEAVARETDLDLRAPSPEAFEELITGLQTAIRVSGGADNIFTILYEDDSREMARDVVAAVLDTFTEDAIAAQGDDAVLSERAVAGEIEDHEQRLRSAEAALAEFKKNNLGYMPGDSGDYYTRLQTALSTVSRTQGKIQQLQQRRDELSRQTQGEEPVFGIMQGAGGGLAFTCSQSGQIADLQTQLSKLLVDFTEKHPRVLTLQETIAGLEQRCAAEGANATANGFTSRPQNSDQPLQINPVYENLRVQLSQTDVDLVEARGELRSAEYAVESLRRDVDKIAEVETQLKQLNRDYDVVQARHQELLRRWEDLQAKRRLDPVTDNMQFRRIEPPFALAEPVGPNRPMLLAAVLFLAIGGGAALAFGLSQLHPVYFTRRSMRLAGLPVLGAVTMLLTPEAVRLRRAAALAWGACYAVLLVSMGLAIGYSSRVTDLVLGLSG